MGFPVCALTAACLSENLAREAGCIGRGVFTMQRGLSKAQSFFVFGPLVVSPIKAVVSVVTLVVGLVLAGAAFLFSCGNEKMLEFSGKAALIAYGLGGVSLGYAVANIATFGVLAACLEGTCNSCTSN